MELTELQRSLLILVDYYQPFSPTDVMYDDELNELCKMGLLVLLDIGYVTTDRGQEVIYQEVDGGRDEY